MSASNLELVRHILTETAFIIQHTDKKTRITPTNEIY
jgi:hypothetical protein